MSYKSLFSHHGRLPRRIFWRFYLLAILGFVLATYIDIKLSSITNFRRGDAGYATLIFSLLVIWPSIVIQIKRWHDINRTGWWSLVVFIPFIGIPWMLVANGTLPGTKGPNRFGTPYGDEEKKQAEE